ncbi:MAG TPA: Imm6 family immunity protein [Clostridia bacterium]
MKSEEEFTISDVEWKVKDNKEKLPIIKTITVALMYVIWRAFKKDGEGLPESIEEVDEDAIKYLVEYVNECVGFKAIWIDELKDYMVKNYEISENHYGKPIEKNIMTEVAKCFK